MKTAPHYLIISLLFLCLSTSAWAQPVEFKSEGFSRQINVPDNKGTININQYLIKSDDYLALTKQLDNLDKAISEKREDCAAFEAAGNADRLIKCRQGLTQLHTERDSTEQIITQFREDVLRLAQTFEHIPLYSERLRIAKSLFDAGKFREVHAVMNTQEMIEEGNALLLKKNRLQSGLEETDSLLQIKAEEFIVKAQAKAVDYEDPKRIDSTALCYRQSLRYSDNVENLYNLAEFFSHNHQYDSTLVYFQKVIVHPKVEDWQVANAYCFMGNMHTATGNLAAALDAYMKTFESYEKLYHSDPVNSFYKQNLAVSYEKLGEMHTTLGNLQKALTFFEDETKLFKELHEAYQQNMEFKNGLAISYSKLGSTHTALGNLQKALIFFEQYKILEKELHETNPQNVSFKNSLAISYEKLGSTHTALGNLPKALTFFERYNNLGKELHEAYPQNVEFKNGLAISYSKLGSAHTALGNLSKALTFFDKDIKLSTELHEAYPQNVEFKNGLAISYSKLGSTHTSLGNLQKALTFFERYNNLEKELHEAYPQNVDFKNGLAISYEKLGETHTSLGNLQKALTFFEDETKLFEELHEAYPQNVSFKNGLAISYVKLAQINIEFKNFSKAIEYLQAAEKLFLELHHDSPENAQFKKHLDGLQSILNAFQSIDAAVEELKVLVQIEPDTLAKYQLYTELCDALRHRAAQDSAQKADLADALNGRAWTGFFLKKFAAVEADIREGLALGIENKYLSSNLAPALLLQGKKAEALAEYKKRKNMTFLPPDYPTYRDAFLADLDTFEAAGIIPPERKKDVAAARDLLKR